ncbi:hypothetical protein HK104_002132 [Borealophlyctis nickersoniae]|nr:hypothetical protein HK104_002132 [Borealophlyctis nickersoniae]
MDIQLSTSWPFLALIGVITFGYTLLTKPIGTAQNGLSTPANIRSWLKRTEDVRWWMQLALPMYFLHQFEEYGLDLYGRHFQFQYTLCSNLGFDNVSECPIRPWHTTFINAGLVTLATLRARRAVKGPGANFYGLALINGIWHCIVALKDAHLGKNAYNPGLLTAITVLFPSGCCALRALKRQGVLTNLGVARAVAIGIVAHIVLLTGLFLRSTGKIGDEVFVLWELFNFVVVLTLSYP